MAKVGVLLCGCGHRDGSEIHEAVIAMLALQEVGATIQCLSLDKPQAKLFNHKSGKPVDGSRNMLEESARIARGRYQGSS